MGPPLKTSPNEDEPEADRGVSIPNCLAYSEFSRCQPPNGAKRELVSVCQLVPDRSKIDEDQRAENREPFKYAKGADRRGHDGPHKQPSTRDECGDPSQHQIDGHKVVLAPHDVKYSRQEHDQRQAEGTKRRELRFDSGHRRQDQADASKKLRDPELARSEVGSSWLRFPLDSRILSRLRRPVGRFNTELLGVLRVQPLPAAELHRLATRDAAARSPAEKAIQNIQ